MSGQTTSPAKISASFSDELASVLFNTPPDPMRDGDEVEVVQKFEEWIRNADRRAIWRMALLIDVQITPLLSGKNLLHVARLLEERAPTVIESMTNLNRHKSHLRRSAELAEILSARALDRLNAALAEAADEPKTTAVKGGQDE